MAEEKKWSWKGIIWTWDLIKSLVEREAGPQAWAAHAKVAEYEAFLSYWKDLIRKPATRREAIAAIVQPGLWLISSVIKLFPNTAIYIGQSIAAKFYDIPEGWAGFVSGYMTTMCEAPVTIPEITSAAGRKKAYTTISKQIFDRMLGLIIPKPRAGGGIDPIEGVRSAERYLSANMKFQMDAWLLHLIGDFFSFGIIKSLKDLPNAISWSFGLGWLSWLVMGVPFKMVISDPMEQYFNNIYRPVRLTPIQAAEALRKGLIDSKSYTALMAGYGYPDWLTDIVFRLGYKEIPDTIIRRCYDLKLITETQAIDEYKRKGFTDSQAKLIVKLLSYTRKLDLMDKLIDEACNQYTKGMLSRAILEAYLKEADFDTEEIALTFSLLDLRKASAKALSDSELRQALYKGLISFSDCKNALMQRGMDPLDADIFLEIGKPMLSSSDIRTAAKKKFIAPGTALALLQSLGWDSNQALLYLALVET